MIKPPLIVCAALKNGKEIIIGPRHYDAVMVKQIDKTGKSWKGATQGFIDQFGKFYTRQEAWKVAESNNQIKYNLAIADGMLFSEHLY